MLRYFDTTIVIAFSGVPALSVMARQIYFTASDHNTKHTLAERVEGSRVSTSTLRHQENMFKLSNPTNMEATQCTPNLLPCRIHHHGPVHASPRYWSPQIAEDGKPEAYFRGRKLKGKEIRVPEGYRGVVVTVTGRENTLRHKIEEQDIAEEGNDEEEQATELQEMGSFKEIVLWDHERVVDREDAFAKGLGEWIGFAGAMHKPGQVKGT